LARTSIRCSCARSRASRQDRSRSLTSATSDRVCSIEKPNSRQRRMKTSLLTSPSP
jgi:hypothetical protein